MEFKILNGKEKEYYKGAIRDMIVDCDADFLPPLSSRCSTLDSLLSGGTQSLDGIEKYLSGVMSQQILGAISEGVLVGFISFIDNYADASVINESAVYVSTVIISKSERGRGICPRMYSALFDAYCNKSILTRTWSTNSAHTAVLGRLGFIEIKRLKDHRGEGVDTVYYLRDKATVQP